MSSSAPTVTSEVVATHFRRVVEFRANNWLAGGEQYRGMEIEVLSEGELRITGNSQAKAELAMDQAASEAGVLVDYHYGSDQELLVIWRMP
jgi:hypothetical protein